MRLSWAQTAAGALFVIVLGGLAALPGHLLGPSHTMPNALGLPQTTGGIEVQAALPVAPPHRVPPRRAAVRIAVPVHHAPVVTARRPSRVIVPAVEQRTVIARIAPRAATVPPAKAPAPKPALAPAPTPTPAATPAPTPTPAPPAPAPTPTPTAPTAPSARA